VIQTDGPALVVDISTTIDLKIKAFMCHASQIGDMSAVALSIRQRAADLGRPIGELSKMRPVADVSDTISSRFLIGPPGCAVSFCCTLH
jgi:hypothetical protein